MKNLLKIIIYQQNVDNLTHPMDLTVKDQVRLRDKEHYSCTKVLVNLSLSVKSINNEHFSYVVKDILIFLYNVSKNIFILK